MADYQYVLTDLKDDTVRTELPMSAVSFSRELNGPGGFSATLPLSITKTISGETYELIRASEIAPADTAIYVIRDGVVMWGGILWAVRVSSENETLQLAGQGFWSYFARRHIRKTLTHTADEQFDIVEAIIDHAQDDFADGDLGVTVARQPTDSGVNRDRTYYGYERKNVAEAVEQLAAVLDGFDFELEVGGSFGSFTKTLRLWYPRRGRSTEFVWEIGKNIILLDYAIDAERFAKHVTSVGAGEGDAMLVADVTDTSLSEYPLMEQITTYKDVKNIATLEGHARSDLNRHRAFERTAKVRLLNQADSPLGAFIPGDEIRLRASRGYLDIDESWRIMRFTVAPDDAGSESIDVELAPAGAFVT